MKTEPHAETAPETDTQAAELAGLQAHAGAAPDTMATGSPGEPAAAPPKNIPNRALVAPAVGFLCRLAARYLPPPVEEEEKNILIDAYTEALDFYFPAGIPLGPLLGAVAVTMGVFGPRYAEHQIRVQEAAAAKKAAEGTATA